jgi:hypothetical protein
VSISPSRVNFYFLKNINYKNGEKQTQVFKSTYNIDDSKIGIKYYSQRNDKTKEKKAHIVRRDIQRSFVPFNATAGQIFFENVVGPA